MSEVLNKIGVVLILIGFGCVMLALVLFVASFAIEDIF